MSLTILTYTQESHFRAQLMLPAAYFPVRTTINKSQLTRVVIWLLHQFSPSPAKSYWDWDRCTGTGDEISWPNSSLMTAVTLLC